MRDQVEYRFPPEIFSSAETVQDRMTALLHAAEIRKYLKRRAEFAVLYPDPREAAQEFRLHFPQYFDHAGNLLTFYTEKETQ